MGLATQHTNIRSGDDLGLLALLVLRLGNPRLRDALSEF